MNSGRFALLIVGAAWAGACDSSIELEPDPNPVPIVVGTEPSVVSAAGGMTTVTILGHGFVEGAEARWNGAARPTSFVSATSVTMLLDDLDLVTPGPGSITVANPPPAGGSSTAVTVVVGHPIPVLASVFPTTLMAGSSAVLEVHGSGFVEGPPTATVRWNGVDLATVFVSATELMAHVSDGLTQHAIDAVIQVTNPPPAGGVSNPIAFSIVNPSPTIATLSPVMARVNTTGILRISGSGLVPDGRVNYGGTLLEPYSVSAVSLSVLVPAALNQSGDTVEVMIENPPPGGGVSEVVRIPVWERAPSIASLSPPLAFAGSAPFTLAIEGADFGSDATLTWNGEPKTVQVVSSSLIEVPVGAADLATSELVEIRVINAPPAGEDTATFSVISAVPTPSSIGYTANGLLEASQLDGSFRIPQKNASGDQADAAHSSWLLAYRGHVGGIYLHDLERDDSRALLNDNVEERWPRFSADDVWVYFSRLVDDVWEAWRARADGSAYESLRGSALYVAPDHTGSRVVFSNGNEPYGSLTVKTLATGQESTLGSVGAVPRWAPDDQWIAYIVGGELRVVRPDGSDDALLNSGPFSDSFDWASNGASLLAVTPAGEVHLIAFPSGAAQHLSHLDGVSSVAFFN